MNTNTVYRVFLEKLGGTVPSQFVGDEGELFFDPNIPALKLSNGVTPGGLSVGFGSSEIPQEFVFVNSKSDFPTPSSGVITLENNYTYFICNTVDLLGDRLVAGQNTTIIGGSSENCRIKSTGISTTVALLSSNYSLPLRNITLEAPYAINLDATGYGTQALDWFGVNFTNCAKVGIISSYNNFIMLDGAFLDSQDLTFNGVTGTVGFNQCLFTGNFSLGGAKSILNFPSTFICRRRIRITVCSFVVPSGYTGITVQDGVAFQSANGTYNPESFILQTCNFSGPGITSTGILPNALGISTHTDIDGSDSFYEGNRGINNTFVVGQLYMKNNATQTSFASTDTYVKIAGVTTTTGAINSKFTPTDNRLTCTAGIERDYLIQVSATVVPTTNTTLKLAIYDSSVVGGILQASEYEFEATAGDSKTIHITDLHKHSNGEYVEIHIANVLDTQPVTVTHLNVLTTQIG